MDAAFSGRATGSRESGAALFLRAGTEGALRLARAVLAQISCVDKRLRPVRPGVAFAPARIELGDDAVSVHGELRWRGKGPDGAAHPHRRQSIEACAPGCKSFIVYRFAFIGNKYNAIEIFMLMHCRINSI